jgi:hypothetical protein
MLSNQSLSRTGLLFSVATLTLGLAFAAGCGDSDSDSPGGGGGDPGTTGPTTSSGNTTSSGASSSSSTGTGVPGCEEPTPQPGASNDVPLTNVQASARDETGTGIPNTPFQLCGTDLCLPGTTSAIGLVTFMNSQPALDRPFFKPGDSLTYGKIGYAYTEQSPSPLIGHFPSMTDSGQEMVPGMTISAAGASLVVPEGYTIDTLIYDEPAKQTFRAGTLPTNLVADATGDPAFVMLYALGPFETLLCPPAQLTLDNYANLPADSEVELWGQELGIEELFAGFGEWVHLDDGVVSSDGSTITTVNGIPVLFTIAIKPKD